MAANSAAQSLASTQRPTDWKHIRIGVGAAYLVCEIAIIRLGTPFSGLNALVGNLAFAIVGLTAALLAYRNARSFRAGQTARYAWILIALMPLADVTAYTAYTMPSYLGAAARIPVLIVVATALLSLSRIAAATAFYAMVRVYRKSGLHHRLTSRDYFLMAIVLVFELFALAFSGSGAQASGGTQLAKQILITALPLVVALVPCSIFGVVIWRYTTEMGGGLVAKAWRGTLLYGVAWLAYVMCNALVARYIHITQIQNLSTANLLAFIFSTWILKGSEYLIFLGASYQYEACTSAPDIPDDLSLFADA